MIFYIFSLLGYPGGLTVLPAGRGFCLLKLLSLAENVIFYMNVQKFVISHTQLTKCIGVV